MLKRTGSEVSPQGLRVAPLAVAAVISFAAAANIPNDGLHPLALMASLLPLQLAALLYAFRRG